MCKLIIIFNVCKLIKLPTDLQVVYVINTIDDKVDNAIEVNFMSDKLEGVLWNFGTD